MKCCIENKIKKIIFASSAAVYDESKIPVNENAKTNPSSPYGKSKLAAEQKIKKIQRNLILMQYLCECLMCMVKDKIKSMQG